jgi:hypothetical protein
MRWKIKEKNVKHIKHSNKLGDVKIKKMFIFSSVLLDKEWRFFETCYIKYVYHFRVNSERLGYYCWEARHWSTKKEFEKQNKINTILNKRSYII